MNTSYTEYKKFFLSFIDKLVYNLNKGLGLIIIIFFVETSLNNGIKRVIYEQKLKA
jgi:hypothetical protein